MLKTLMSFYLSTLSESGMTSDVEDIIIVNYGKSPFITTVL